MSYGPAIVSILFTLGAVMAAFDSKGDAALCFTVASLVALFMGVIE